MMTRMKCSLLALMVGAGAPVAQAIELQDAVQQTIVNNPEVRLKLHQFQNAQAEQGLGLAGFFPTADLSYTHGRELAPRDKQERRSFDRTETTLRRWGWSVNLAQNLFNGFQSIHLVQQLDYAQRAQYFQFLDMTEQQALEGARAYLDVLRYRQLVRIAERNFSSHQLIYQQLQSRNLTLAPGVDLEQANGRLALAEANLLTAKSNQEDVAARYERIVGSAAPAEMQAPPVIAWAPPVDESAMDDLLNAHPNNRSARAGLRAARQAVAARRGAFMPALDARARHDWGSGQPGGRSGAHDRKVFELVTSFNLSRGGSDRARLAMAAQALNSALDQRDKACRDTRQLLSMASNDLIKLQHKIPFLQRHALASEKVREAYYQQFKLGKRTLLDLLDSENELYNAQSAEVNGRSDLQLARLRGAAAGGGLLAALQLKPVEERAFADETEAGCMSRSAG